MNSSGGIVVNVSGSLLHEILKSQFTRCFSVRVVREKILRRGIMDAIKYFPFPF